MDVPLARSLARATTLTHELQVQVWDCGDALARNALAGRGDLCASVQDAILTGGDQRALAAWARAERSGPLLLAAARTAESEEALTALGCNPRLPRRALRVVLAKASDAVAVTLLDRSDVHVPPRAMLLRRWVSGLPQEMDRMTQTRTLQTLRKRAPGTPDCQVAVLEVLPNCLAAYLEKVPGVEDRRVQRAAASAIVRLHAADAISPPVLQRAVVDLLRVQDLDPRAVTTLDPVIRASVPEASVLLKARADLDVGRAVATMTCTLVTEPCREPDHVALVAAVIDLAAQCQVRIPASVLAQEAYAHADVVGEQAFARVLSAVTLPVADLVADWEAQWQLSGGPVAPLAHAVRVLGPRALLLLNDPVPVVREGCREGWTMLTSSRNVPASCRAMVVREFATAADLLADHEYAGALVTLVAGALDTRGQEAFWALMPDWSSSAAELVDVAGRL